MTTELGRKLDPRRFPGMSPKMAAIVACVLGDEATFHTEPAIRGFHVTGGLVLAEHADDVGANEVIGFIGDFKDNWARLIEAAELDPGEEWHLQQLISAHIKDWSTIS